MLSSLSLLSSPSPLTALDGRRCLSIVHEWIKPVLPVYSNTYLLVVVQGVCDLIGFPSETRRTDYLDRRGGRVAVPIHYSIHLINPSQRCDSGACCVTFCLRL